MFGQLRFDSRGSVTIMAAVMFAGLIGIAGLVTEYGDALLTRVNAQREADLAAYSGALAYNATSSTTALNAAVRRSATLNGFTSSQVVGSLVTSPSGDGNQAVRVVVTVDVALSLSRSIERASQVVVSATSYAELKSNGTACIIALESGGTGVTMSGGTVLSAPSCAVASNNTVTVPCGTALTTITVDYDSAAVPSQPCGGIQAPSGKSLSITKKSTADPLAGTSPITIADAHVSTVAAIIAPSAPTPSNGTTINFAYTTSGSTSPTALAAAMGCTATFSSPTWTLTCSGAGPFNFLITHKPQPISGADMAWVWFERRRM
jgi:hypothetical protein